MKTRNILFAGALFLSGIFFTQCTEDKIDDNSDSILPSSFKVDIPDAISNDNVVLKSGNKSSEDTLNGGDIYGHLANFIAIGEGAADIVEDIIYAIHTYGINKPMIFSYNGDEDGRVKNAEVIEKSTFEGVEYEFEMTITDAESESNADGGYAMQIFWDRNPVKGIALLKPTNINKDETEAFAQATFRIDYTEDSEFGYDAHMIVSIVDIPLANPLVDPYSVKNLKMFAGVKGDIVDVYGNSDHPNARFFGTDVGFNWAFVASGNDKTDIGVAEVALPPSNLDESSRSGILDYYSIVNVFTREITAVYPQAPQSIIDAYLFNADAPGFFDTNGFVQGGTAPSSDYDVLTSRIENLTPYSPLSIQNLTITFKE